MKFLRAYIKFADKLSSYTGIIFSSLAIALVLIVCYDVLTRYFLNHSSVAVQDVQWHLFALIFLGTAAYALKLDEHVRVDVLYARLSDRGKAWVDLLGSVVFLIPFCILIIVSSLVFVKTSFLMREGSPDAGGLGARYLLKAFIPLSFFLLMLQGVSQAFKSLIKISGKETEGGAAVD